MTALIDLITAHLGKKGGAPKLSPAERDDTIVMTDQSDGRGPYIDHWGSELGPVPTEADGFTAYHVHRIKG
jgi:hypothetical protein